MCRWMCEIPSEQHILAGASGFVPSATLRRTPKREPRKGEDVGRCVIVRPVRCEGCPGGSDGRYTDNHPNRGISK